MVIGITGGVGSGKSEVIRYIAKNYNATVLLADDIAKELMSVEQAGNTALKELLPGECFLEDGNIDRKAMAAVFFKDKGMQQRVNSVIFPLVKEYIKESIKTATTPLIIIEAALLIEEHYEEICDKLIYVYAKRQVRVKRLQESRGYSIERIDAMMASQLSEEEFRENTDITIDNSGGLEDTIRIIDKELSGLGVKRWEQ